MDSFACPDRNQLRDYSQGNVPEAEAVAIVEHLDRCPECEAIVDAWESQGDRVIDALRTPRIEDPYEHEPGCRDVTVRAIEFGRELSSGPGSASPQLGTAPAEQFAPTQIGAYQILERIGAGGMGTVYKAVHTRLQKIVALKVLPSHKSADPAAIARFRRELLAVGQLDHPHIVRATDAGDFGGLHYLAMEFVDGRNLAEILESHGPLPIPDACELIRQAALGLQEAHERGLVHRDIKPSNLMLARSPRPHEPPTVKLLDMGLALLANFAISDPGGELTSASQVVGTLEFMSPEQVTDTHHVDIRADIYSLGASLFKLLTGQSPLRMERNRSPLARMASIAKGDLIPLESLRSHVSASLEALVTQMLHRTPEGRPATPEEVAIRLTPWCVGHDLRKLLEPRAESRPMTADHDATTPQDRSPHRIVLRTVSPLEAGSVSVTSSEAPTVIAPRTELHEFAAFSQNSRPLKKRSNQDLRTVIAVASVLVAAVLVAGYGLRARDGNKSPGGKAEMTSNAQQPPRPEPVDAPEPETVETHPASLEANRRAVKWTLEIGGQASVVEGDRRRVLRDANDLTPEDHSIELSLRKLRSVTDAGLENLKGADAVTSLDLGGCPGTSLEVISTLPRLSRLFLGGPMVRPQQIDHLQKATALRSLWLGANDLLDPPGTVNNAVVASVCQITQLKEFSLFTQRSELTNDGLIPLKKLSSLEQLTIHGVAINDEGLAHLLDLKELKSLGLRLPNVRGEGLESIAQISQLGHLSLYCPQLTDSSLIPLRALQQLWNLGLSECPKVTGASFSALGDMPLLRNLSLHQTGITDEALSEIARRPTIMTLALSRNPGVTNKGLARLIPLKRLRNLSLVENPQLTDEAIPALKQLTESQPDLSAIYLKGTKLSSEGRAELRTLRVGLLIVD